MKTINHDDFATGTNVNSVNIEKPHVIIYGCLGWTDVVESATLEALVNAGAIRFVRAIEGDSFITHIYESVKGDAP
jgi:hypothetical protein